VEQAFDITAGIRVRKVTMDDATALRTYCFPSDTLEKVEKQLKQDIGKMERGEMFRMVAEVNGYAIGNIQLDFNKRNRKTAQIHKLIVTGPFRGSATADRLVEAVCEMAKQSGVELIQLEAQRSDGKIIEKYKSWGFEEKETIILEKKL